MTQTGNPFPDYNRRGMPYVLLLVSVCCVYLSALWGTFQFDDYNMIVSNPAVRSLAGWLAKTAAGGIRPLLNLTYVINWLAGHNAFGFHLVNVCIHAATTLLVYACCRRFTSACRQDVLSPEQSRSASLLAAMLFAVHPLQTEAVTYITGRSSSLMAMFFMASVLAYVHGLETGKPGWYLLVSPLFFVASVATKEVAVFLPFALLLWERCVNRSSFRTLISRQALHWALLVVLMAAILLHPRYVSLFLYSLKIRSFHDNLLSQLNGVYYLVSRLILPGSLNIDPDIPAAAQMDVRMMLTLSAGSAAVLFSVWKRHARPWLIFAMLWFSMAVFPSSALIPRTDVVNERHMYLANFGIFLCAGIEAVKLGERMHMANAYRQVMAVVIVCCLGVFTIMRNFDYRSEIALWESSAARSPAKSRVFNNLGCAYEVAGMNLKATAAYSRSLELNKNNSIAFNNLNRITAKSSESQP